MCRLHQLDLEVLGLATDKIRHRFINNFIIFKTPTFGKWQSVISEICFLTSQRSAQDSASDLFGTRGANILSAAIWR